MNFTTRFSTPCTSLSDEQRAQRLASYRLDRPETKVIPGECQVCGHAIKTAYRACKPHDTGEGIAERFEAAPGSKQANEIAEKIRNGGGLFGIFEATGWLVLPVSACDGLDGEVWARSSAIVEERKRERANVGKPPAPQPEPQIKQPRRFGQIAPMSREQLTA